MEKKVEYNMITGSVLNVLPSLERSVLYFESRYMSVKVGITGRNPQERFNEHLKDRRWNRMIVKYKTTSESLVNKLEDYFILYHPRLKNNWIGYSHLSKDGYNYFYILLYGKK